MITRLDFHLNRGNEMILTKHYITTVIWCGQYPVIGSLVYGFKVTGIEFVGRDF